MPVTFSHPVDGSDTSAPPPWSKEHAPFNALAYLIDKERVVKGMKPQKVHELLTLFSQYTLTRFRNNYNNMLKKYAAGTLTYNIRKIPDEVMTMIREGKLGGARSADTQAGLDGAFESKL